jgi:hypothetical protein
LVVFSAVVVELLLAGLGVVCYLVTWLPQQVPHRT